MANAAIFSSQATAVRNVPKADVRNDAGGLAYQADPKYALALYACTGTFNGTYYASGEEHLDRVKGLLAQVDDLAFIAKVAVYAREKSHMKDTPTFLLAHLMTKDERGDLFARAFPRVVDNGKMACTFWQIVRSGAAGRKSLGSRPKRVFARWFESLSNPQLFRASIGTSNPSLADVIRVVHPSPGDESRRALYGYLSGRNPEAFKPGTALRSGHLGYNPEAMDPLVKAVEAFKANSAEAPIPDVSFQLLSSLPLERRHWTEIALKAMWQTLRMNLNTFARHGVLTDNGVVNTLAAKLRDEEAIRRARVFPYQVLVAYLNASDGIPRPLVDALHDAMEIATANVPIIEGNVVICPDVSRSMSSPITGHRPGASSKVRCIDVAALFTACLLRKNPSARVMPFEVEVVDARRGFRLEPRDSIMTNATKLASIGGGGTNCAAPLARLNVERSKVDSVVFVSDNESWVDTAIQGVHGGIYAGRTGMAVEWAKLAAANHGAKLVCIDIVPRTNLQTASRDDTLCVGGFSDEVFTVASQFLSGALGAEQWLKRIEEVEV